MQLLLKNISVRLIQKIKNFIFNFNKFNSIDTYVNNIYFNWRKNKNNVDDTFLLIFRTLFIFIFKQYIETKNKKFYYIFLTFSSFPTAYLGISLLDETKRTDYPGKEIARLVQNKWNDNFMNEIKIIIGDEWSAGNILPFKL